MKRTAGTGSNGRKRILLIENDPDLRSATLDLLETLGYEVVVAKDADQAIEAIRRSAFDLAFVNAYPEQGRGTDIVDSLRATVPGLPALLASGFGDDAELRRRVLEGDIGFLPMPFSLKRLEREVGKALEQKPSATRPASGSGSQAHLPAGTALEPRRSRTILGVAAAVAAAGLFVLVTDRPPAMPEPEVGIARGNTIELLDPVGALSDRPTQLVWSEVPGTTRYRVTLSTVDDTTIWRSETTDTSIELPKRVVGQLHAAVSYFWQIEGLAENFSAIGRSRLVAFRFGAPEPAKLEDQQ